MCVFSSAFKSQCWSWPPGPTLVPGVFFYPNKLDQKQIKQAGAAPGSIQNNLGPKQNLGPVKTCC